VRDALAACGWEPRTAAERAVDWALAVCGSGIPPEQQRLKDALPDDAYEWWGQDDHFVVDQRPRG
jgi:hypothetical protein